MTGIARWGASGRNGLPTQMSNGEWVKYADHLQAINERGHTHQRRHLVECPGSAIPIGDHMFTAQSCICQKLEDCERRVAAAFQAARKDDQKKWEALSRDNYQAGYDEGQRDARAEAQGQNCHWATPPCPNGLECLSCRYLTGCLEERVAGEREAKGLEP